MLIYRFSLLLLTLSFFKPLYPETSAVKTQHPVVICETTQGTFEITLYPELAPKTCENFLVHVKNKYYEGTGFHRVIKSFMIQGGDPSGDGTGGQSIWGKAFEDEFSAQLRFDRPGLLAMANRGPNTNGSQFFITVAPTTWLNNKHTIFGEVTKGYDEIVKKIETTPTDGRDRPVQPQKILSMRLKEPS